MGTNRYSSKGSSRMSTTPMSPKLAMSAVLPRGPRTGPWLTRAAVLLVAVQRHLFQRRRPHGKSAPGDGRAIRGGRAGQHGVYGQCARIPEPIRAGAAKLQPFEGCGFREWAEWEAAENYVAVPASCTVSSAWHTGDIGSMARMLFNFGVVLYPSWKSILLA